MSDKNDRYVVYTLAPRLKEDKRIDIGYARPRPDGFDIVLEALPVNGKIFLRKIAKETSD